MNNLLNFKKKQL